MAGMGGAIAGGGILGVLGLLGGIYQGKKMSEINTATEKQKNEREFHEKTILNPAIESGDLDTIDQYGKVNQRYFSKENIELMRKRAEANTEQKRMQRILTTLQTLQGGGQAAPQQEPMPQQGMPDAGPVSEQVTGGEPVSPPMQSNGAPQGQQRMYQAPNGSATPQAPAPQAAPAAAPARRGAGLQVTGVNVSGKGETSFTLGHGSEHQSDKEALIDFYDNIQNKGMTPMDSMEAVEAGGKRMNNQLQQRIMGTYFDQIAKANKDKLMQSGLKLTPDELMMKAAQLTLNEVPGMFAGAPWTKYIDRMAEGKTLTDAQRLGLSNILADPQMNSDQKAAAIVQLTGQSPTAFGVSIPSGRQRAFEQLPMGDPNQPYTQQGIVAREPTTIIQTDSGPQAVARTPGAALPKPPMPPKEAGILNSAKQGFKVVARVQAAYNAMVKAHGPANFSKQLRESIAANDKVSKFDALTGLVGKTKEEIEFATAYNRLLGNLKSLMNIPGSFSDQEAMMALQSLGTAALGRGQFSGQLRKTLDDLSNVHNDTLGSLTRRGFATDQEIELDPNVGRRIKTKDGVQVWGGKEKGWVPEAQFKVEGMQ